MRGTLTAREMAAKERIPSIQTSVQVNTFFEGKEKHTHGCNDLRLHSILVLEPTGKVADATFTVARDIWNLADVVEHVTASEEQNGDEADGGPDVAALSNGPDVGPSDVAQGGSARDEGEDGEPLYPVEGPLDGRMWAVRCMASDPVVDLLGALWTVCKVIAEGFCGGRGVGTDGGLEEKEDGGSLEAQLAMN